MIQTINYSQWCDLISANRSELCLMGDRVCFSGVIQCDDMDLGARMIFTGTTIDRNNKGDSMKH